MIRIFHGFPLGMWGDTPINIWGEDEVPYCRNESPVGQFQIIGRRTFTADAAKCPTVSSDRASFPFCWRAKMLARFTNQPHNLRLQMYFF